MSTVLTAPDTLSILQRTLNEEWDSSPNVIRLFVDVVRERPELAPSGRKAILVVSNLLPRIVDSLRESDFLTCPEVFELFDEIRTSEDRIVANRDNATLRRIGDICGLWRVRAINGSVEVPTLRLATACTSALQVLFASPNPWLPMPEGQPPILQAIHQLELIATVVRGADLAWEFAVPYADVFRHCVRHPLRAGTFDPSWRTEPIVSLAQRMYDSNDFTRLPDLADLLEDEDCADVELLSHCRSQGVRCRGGWGVDLILGKA